MVAAHAPSNGLRPPAQAAVPPASRRRLACWLLPCLGAVAGAAAAQQPAQAPPLQWPRWSLQGAAVSLRADTQVLAGTSAQVQGTDVDFETTLGLAQRQVVHEGLLTWRPGPRHRLGLGRFRAERSAGATITGELRFAGETFTAGTTLASRFVTAVTSADYAYAVWQRPRGELTLGLGAHRVALQAELAPMSGTHAASESAALLVPTLRLGAAASWGTRWVVHGHRHELRLQRGPYAGRLRSQTLGVDLRLHPQWVLCVGHRHFSLAMQVDRPDWTGRARSRYAGLFVGASLSFQ